MSRLIPPALAGTVAYEYRMAARRKVLWLATVPLLVLAVLLLAISPRAAATTTAATVAAWALFVNLLGGLGLGTALADRFTRTQRPGLAELLAATPASATARQFGTLVGSLAAALVPAAVTMLLVGIGIGVDRRDLSALPWTAFAFLTIVLPGALLLTLFAATAGLLLPVPVARVLAVGIWFWATVFNPSLIPLPTITGTVLSPLGDYVAAGWMGGEVVWAGRGAPGWLSPAVDGASAWLNLGCLLLLAALLFVSARLIAALRC